MRFYKAIIGTEVHEKYGDELIHQDAVAFSMNNEQRRQIEDATPEDLARAYNDSACFDPDIFQALADMAEIEIDSDEEIDIDSVISEIGKILNINLD